jgi:hypothetical protein
MNGFICKKKILKFSLHTNCASKSFIFKDNSMPCDHLGTRSKQGIGIREISCVEKELKLAKEEISKL